MNQYSSRHYQHSNSAVQHKILPILHVPEATGAKDDIDPGDVVGLSNVIADKSSDRSLVASLKLFMLSKEFKKSSLLFTTGKFCFTALAAGC